MAHLTEQLRHGLLARSLPLAETVAAIEHIRTCASCRDDLIALRREKVGSLDDQILPALADEEHPPADLLAAYADGDLRPDERASITEHVGTCSFCREIVLDLGNFRNELLQLPAKEFRPGLQGNREHSQRGHQNLPAVWDRVAEWFFKPVILGTAVAAVFVITVGLISTQLFHRPPEQGQAAVDTVQDGSLTFRVTANGQITPSSTQLPEDAVAVLTSSILELARASLPSVQAMRGLSETPEVNTNASPAAMKLPAGEYFFSRSIFGAIVALPRATPDPDVQPNGIVIRDPTPVLSWSSLSDGSSNQTLTVRDCATDQIVVETEMPGNIHSFSIPVSLARGSFYFWQVTDHAATGPGKTVSGRFKLISDRDLQSLSSPAGLSSHLLQAFLLARAGLFAEADSELTELAASNPKSPTIVSALNYVRELEGI
jgi:predicted anti-sigma-YlaC factor YlaD